MNPPGFDPAVDGGRAKAGCPRRVLRLNIRTRAARFTAGADRLLRSTHDEDVATLDCDLGGLRHLLRPRSSSSCSFPADARAEADLKVMLRFAAEPRRS